MTVSDRMNVNMGRNRSWLIPCQTKGCSWGRLQFNVKINKDCDLN